MLYAYGIGMGADPMDEKELAFLNEAVATPRLLKIVPTFASVAAWEVAAYSFERPRSAARDEQEARCRLKCQCLVQRLERVLRPHARPMRQ